MAQGMVSRQGGHEFGDTAGKQEKAGADTQPGVVRGPVEQPGRHFPIDAADAPVKGQQHIAKGDQPEDDGRGVGIAIRQGRVGNEEIDQIGRGGHDEDDAHGQIDGSAMGQPVEDGQASQSAIGQFEPQKQPRQGAQDQGDAYGGGRRGKEFSPTGQLDQHDVPQLQRTRGQENQSHQQFDARRIENASHHAHRRLVAVPRIRHKRARNRLDFDFIPQQESATALAPDG